MLCNLSCAENILWTAPKTNWSRGLWASLTESNMHEISLRIGIVDGVLDMQIPTTVTFGFQPILNSSQPSQCQPEGRSCSTDSQQYLRANMLCSSQLRFHMPDLCQMGLPSGWMTSLTFQSRIHSSTGRKAISPTVIFLASFRPKFSSKTLLRSGRHSLIF